MYESFYELSSNPFRLAPDPKFTFSHPSYDKANAYLEYALNLSEGFVIVTGRPGTGKTTLINTFLRSHKVNRLVAAKVAVPNLDANELLRAVAYAYKIDVEGLDMASILRRLEQFFIQQVLVGKRILLIIDEAQSLSRCALEELRMLADMQTESRFLVQIFLVGQAKLLEHMAVPEMEQFQQRVTGTCKLVPLNLRQTRDYVEYRLCRVGWAGDPELTGPAVHAIYQYSNGIPRHINKICARLLLLQGMVEKKHTLDESDVLEVARGFTDEQLAPMLPVETMSAVGAVGELGTVASINTYSELALKAPPDGPAGCPPVPVKPVLASALENKVERTLASEHRESRRVHKAYGRLWMPVAAIGGLVACVLTVTLVFYELNQGDVSDLWASHEDGYEWVWTYEEYPASEKSDSVAISKQQSADSTAREPRQLGASHEESDGLRVSEPEKNSRDVTPATYAESTDIPVPDSLVDDDSASETIAVASMETLAPEQPASAAVITAQPQPDVAGDNKRNMVEERHEPVIAAAAVGHALPGTGTSVPEAPESEQVLHSEVSYSREQKIARLLSLAGESLRENRLLIPADNNAHDYYLQVKALDPGNREAAAGIERITERYILFAEQAIERDDVEMANRYVERGLRVDAANSNLLALQTALLYQAPQASTSVRTEAVRGSSSGSQTVLSRLKQIFDSNQPGFSAPPIWHDEEGNQ